MNIKKVNNTSAIRLMENATELFQLPKYRSKEYVEAFIGLGVHRSSFYGRLRGNEVAALKRVETVFNSPETVTLAIEGVVVLGSVPVNNGSGDIAYSGYGVLEVNDVTIYDGRGAIHIQDKSFKVTYYEIIDISAGTSGSLQDTPTGAVIQENQFGESGNAVLSTLTGASTPTMETPDNGGAVTVSLDTSGNWVSNTTYADPVALIYSFVIPFDCWGEVNQNNIVDYFEIQDAAAVNYDDTTTALGSSNVQGAIELLNSKVGGGVTSSTGVLTGGVISNGTLASQYSISDGTGQIVDNTGARVNVSWTNKTDIIPANIATNLRSYLAIDSSGNVFEQVTEFTVAQSRAYIILGLVVHVDGASIFVVNNKQHIAYNAMNTTYDLAEAIGIFNIKGNVFSGNSGGNLSLDKTSGDVFRAGSNYEIDANNPHERTLPSLTALTFNYVFNDNSNSGSLTLVDPSGIDDGAGGVTPLTNNTKWSVQRIYSFTSNVVALQRGVKEYDTEEDAIAGINSEEYFIASSLEANGLLRGWLVINKIATDLTDPLQASFIAAPKFGGGGGSASGGGSLVDLQTAYNNSITPEMVTDATRGALTLKQGSGLDTDFILEGLNGAGSVEFAVRADGCVRASTVDVVHNAVGPDDHALEIDVNANGNGDVKALDIDYITGAIADGQDEAVMLANIDMSASTGGDIIALDVLATEGDAKAIAILAGVGVDPLEHLSGVFVNMDSALNNGVDARTSFITTGDDVELFSGNGDTLTIGHASKFQEIEFLLSIFSSKNIQPTFEYSVGVGGWAVFTPVDGTNGMLNNGVIAWLNSDIPAWIPGLAGEYLIRVTRNVSGLPTPPTESKIQIAPTTEFYWNKNAELKINKLRAIAIDAYDDDTAAGVAGLVVGDTYQTTGAGAAPLNTAGIMMIKQ